MFQHSIKWKPPSQYPLYNKDHLTGIKWDHINLLVHWTFYLFLQTSRADFKIKFPFRLTTQMHLPSSPDKWLVIPTSFWTTGNWNPGLLEHKLDKALHLQMVSYISPWDLDIVYFFGVKGCKFLWKATFFFSISGEEVRKK